MPGIVIVGEAWGEEEERRGKAFVGPSGGVLNGILAQAGIERASVHVTNCFNLRPKPRNDIKNLCGPATIAISDRPPLAKGKYIRAEYANELERLNREINDAKPNVIIALGATASWALLDTQGIAKHRGTVGWSHRLQRKVVPTYHPAAVIRDWKLRPIVIADVGKALTESASPEWDRPIREIWTAPSLDDIEDFYHQYILPSESLAFDIETIKDQITCIGFAPSTDRALVIPFYDPTRNDKNYWHKYGYERQAWNWVRRILAQPKKISVGQNTLYDINFLWSRYGITVPAYNNDTMLLHHALQPEMRKSLGFLGSIYTNEASWKHMRTDHTTRKRED